MITTEQKLREAREAYYGEEESTLTDAEYDALEDELRAIDPDHELLKEVGSKPKSNWEKVKHSIPMGSLFKVQNKEQWNEWVRKLPLNPKTLLFAITEKFDGISISLEYINGKLIKALSRGDGIVGEDITQNVLKMKNVKEELPQFFTGWLRGEILLFKSDHEKYMPDVKNCRNGAAGTAKRLDGEGCEHLTVQYYESFREEHPPYSLTEQHNQIDNLGLNSTMCVSTTDPAEVVKYMEVWNTRREAMDYEIDGLVVRLNIQSEFEAMGVTDGRPKGAIAYKFPPIQKETTVVAITWQVGRLNRLTPVAELEPVNIGGVTIRRASLHTARMALNMQAGPGSRVIISRANDVIPYLSEVLSPPTTPVVEPTDFGKLEWEGEYLLIKNPDNKIVLYNDIKTWTEQLRVLHWGSSFVKTLIDYELVKSLPDIYRLDWDQVSEFVGKGIAKRAKESLASNGTKMDFASFISALNVRHCK